VTPEVLVKRVSEAKRGYLDEASWSDASSLSLVRAQDGAAAVYPTRVRLLDDGRCLHVRFDCDDGDVWATHERRDAPLWEEEVVELFLAPGPEVPSRYFEIEVNPLATLFDATVMNPDGRRETMRVDPSWHAPGLHVRVERPADAGWRAEIVLPWSDVCEGEPPAVWRSNFFRIERPRGLLPEFSCWSPTRVDPPDFHKPRCFGRLVRGAAR
jgi:hypothetical protein